MVTNDHASPSYSHYLSLKFVQSAWFYESRINACALEPEKKHQLIISLALRISQRTFFLLSMGVALIRLVLLGAK